MKKLILVLTSFVAFSVYAQNATTDIRNNKAECDSTCKINYDLSNAMPQKNILSKTTINQAEVFEDSSKILSYEISMQCQELNKEFEGKKYRKTEIEFSSKNKIVNQKEELVDLCKKIENK